jgi:dynein light chain Tctex-type 1
VSEQPFHRARVQKEFEIAKNDVREQTKGGSYHNFHNRNNERAAMEGGPAAGYQDEVADFNVEDVEKIIREAIVGNLGENSYNVKKVNEWTNAIVASCLKELQALARPFKYVVTCIIMQKNGAGLNTSYSTHWDTGKDGYCKIPWQNATMHCIVTIYGICVHIDDPQED